MLPNNLEEILRSEKENQLIWKPIPVMDTTKIIQDSYFLYNHSNMVKSSFITELNKFVLICGGISSFGEEK